MQTLIDLTSDVATETVAVDVGLHEEEPPRTVVKLAAPGVVRFGRRLVGHRRSCRVAENHETAKLWKISRL